MSILTSATEQTEAKAQLAALPVEQLERDLVFWATAKADHHGRFAVASATMNEARERYLEADAWQDLVGAELALRRRAEQP